MPKMFSFFIVLSVLLILFVSVALANGRNDMSLDLDLVLKAIVKAEDWKGRGTGEHGELGPLQIRPSIWLAYSFKPIKWAEGTHQEMKYEQMRVGQAVIEDIDLQLAGLKLPRTAYSVALVYNAGQTNVKFGNISRGTRDYAERVQNIYAEMVIKEATEPQFYKLGKSSQSITPGAHEITRRDSRDSLAN